MLTEKLGRRALAALLGASLSLSPLFLGGCSNSSDTATKVESKEASADRLATDSVIYENDMFGLTDEEAAELKALYGKRADSWDTGEELSYEENMRVLALEHKVLIAHAREDGYISEDEIAELEGLLAEFDGLSQGEYLDYDKWDRIQELEALAAGYEPSPTQREMAEEPQGLTDEERAELIDINYRDAQDYERSITPDPSHSDRQTEFWERDRQARVEEALGPDLFAEYNELMREFDALGQGQYLDFDKWDRIQELEAIPNEIEVITNRDMAADLHGLTDEQMADAIEIYYHNDQDQRRGFDVDEASMKRLEQYVETDRKSRLSEKLGPELYAEYEGLIKEFEALPEGSYLSEEKWDRIGELECQGSEVSYDFQSQREIANEKPGLTDEEKDTLAELYCHREQEWRRGNSISEEDNLTIEKLEQKAEMGEAQQILTADEYAEYETLMEKRESGEEMSDDEWARYDELWEKVYGEVIAYER